MVSSATAPAVTAHAQDRQLTTREYVRTSELVAHVEKWLAKPGSSIMALADAAGVSTRAIGKVLTHEAEHQTLFLADKLMTAMGGHVIELDTVFLPIKRSDRKAAVCASRVTRSERTDS